MKKGFLITFEGGEGVGKTTQIIRLRKNLQFSQKDVVALREPGGTVVSEQIRKVVLSSKNIGIAYTTEVLLFQAARAQIYREIVSPSLKAKKIVLMDRSRDSSVVYQGMVRCFGVDKIDYLNNLSTNNTFPDLTFLLDAPIQVGLKRRFESKLVNRLDMENNEFHEKVRQAYLELVKKNDHNRWIKIDATKSLKEVENDIWVNIETLIGLKAK